MHSIKKVCEKVDLLCYLCPTTEQACKAISEKPDRWIAVVTAPDIDNALNAGSYSRLCDSIIHRFIQSSLATLFSVGRIQLLDFYALMQVQTW